MIKPNWIVKGVVESKMKDRFLLGFEVQKSRYAIKLVKQRFIF